MLCCVLPVCYDMRLSHLNNDYLLTYLLNYARGAQDAAVELPFVYAAGNWSECSVDCGHGGFQTRSVACALLGRGWMLNVDRTHCDSRTTANLRRPMSERDCSYVDTCPRWTTAEWRQVSPSLSLYQRRLRGAL